MKRISALFLLICLAARPLGRSPLWAQPPSPLSSLQDSFRSVAQRARPACVNISAYHEEEYRRLPNEFYFMDPDEFLDEFFYGAPHSQRPKVRKRRYAGTGSGVIIDPQGYVLTNAHVVAGADEITIRLNAKNGKKTYKGRVTGTDDRLDLALIKIEGPGPFPSVPMADSNQVQVGDWAIAIGSPFELEQTLTVGVISALRQSLPIEGRVYRNLIQTDAAINRGNSGGPLLNINSEVIGINTAIFSPSGVFSGIGFAIPVNAAKEILAELRSGKERQWGWLGISVGEIDESLIKQFGLAGEPGAMVNEVFKSGPAQKAGLAHGDVITAVNHVPVKNPNDLTESVRKLPPGTTIKVAVFRQGKEKLLTAVIGERPKWADVQGATQETPSETPEPSPDTAKTKVKETSFVWEGIELLDIKNNPKGKALARKNRADPSAEGIMVGAIESASPVSGYLETGDIILELNRQRTATIAQFKHAARSASIKEGVVLDILRGENKQYISIQAQDQQKGPRGQEGQKKQDKKK